MNEMAPLWRLLWLPYKTVALFTLSQNLFQSSIKGFQVLVYTSYLYVHVTH